MLVVLAVFEADFDRDRVAELIVVLRDMTVPVAAPILPPTAVPTAPVPATAVVVATVAFETEATSEETVLLSDATAEEIAALEVTEAGEIREEELALGVEADEADDADDATALPPVKVNWPV